MGTPKTSFTRHAYNRCYERLTLDFQKVGELLDNNLAVRIGEEKGTKRVHRLFYSEQDRQHFVAIQDEKDGTVVTILPIDYYATLNAVIPVVFLKEATELICPKIDNTPPKKLKKPPEVPQRSFKIVGTYMNTKGIILNVNIGSIPAGPYDNSIEKFIKDPDTNSKICGKIKNKVTVREILGYSIRLGSKDMPTWVRTVFD